MACAACSWKAPRGDLLLDAPQARPTLAAAAALGVPVFVHPVTDPAMHERFKRHGRLGVRLARSTINSAALFAMLEGGVFDELPNLQVVVTTLAIGGVLMAGGFGDGSRLRQRYAGRQAPPRLYRHHGPAPALLRSAVDLLGADHVLVGTDWPIAEEKSVQDRLQKAFAICGLTAAEQQMIASGNVQRLLDDSELCRRRMPLAWNWSHEKVMECEGVMRGSALHSQDFVAILGMTIAAAGP